MARELFEDKSRAMNMASSSSSSMGFVYPGSDQDPIQIQPDIFSLTNGMEMIGFSKNSHHQPPPDAWKAFFAKNANPTTVGSSAGPPKTLPHPNNDPSSTGFYGQFGSSDLMDQSGAVSWQGGHVVDDSSLRCVFPCEGNERPSQGLSLSLSSTNPSGIGLQSFELRQTQHQNDSDHMRFRSNNVVNNSFSDQMMTIHNSFNLRNSKYLAPAQDLLNEFCSLETTTHQANKRNNHHKNNFLESCDVDNNGNGSSSSSSRNKLQNQSPSSSSLYALDVIELQKRKAKLLSMLEEVDRRYRHYNDQMKAVESVLESAAGAGSATVYSALASKAMSRHFRCLRDGIVGQIQATKKAIGEKDPVAPGASRGETPRLRVLDQTLRQQRAFQQMTMMESHPWRPQRGLPERSVSVLRAWLFEHFLHPYPSDVDKHILARQTGLSRSQVSNWFINARVRLWKPMVEEMYVEETKEQDNLNNNNIGGGSSDGVTTTDPDVDHPSGRPNHHHEDHKPTPAQLVRIDSECLSSIISNPDKDSSSKNNNNNMSIINNSNNNNYNTTSYGAMELDFASYNHHHSVNTVSFHDSAANINFNGGVSLTLGLQQHGNNSNSSNGSGGVSLAFFNPRSSTVHHHHEEQHDQMEPVVQYTMMDSEGQNLPYRNLMGAQLLHDLAG